MASVRRVGKAIAFGAYARIFGPLAARYDPSFLDPEVPLSRTANHGNYLEYLDAFGNVPGKRILERGLRTLRDAVAGCRGDGQAAQSRRNRLCRNSFLLRIARAPVALLPVQRHGPKGSLFVGDWDRMHRGRSLEPNRWPVFGSCRQRPEVPTDHGNVLPFGLSG